MDGCEGAGRWGWGREGEGWCLAVVGLTLGGCEGSGRCGRQWAELRPHTGAIPPSDVASSLRNTRTGICAAMRSRLRGGSGRPNDRALRPFGRPERFGFVGLPGEEVRSYSWRRLLLPGGEPASAPRALGRWGRRNRRRGPDPPSWRARSLSSSHRGVRRLERIGDDRAAVEAEDRDQRSAGLGAEQPAAGNAGAVAAGEAPEGVAVGRAEHPDGDRGRSRPPWPGSLRPACSRSAVRSRGRSPDGPPPRESGL